MEPIAGIRIFHQSGIVEILFHFNASDSISFADGQLTNVAVTGN